MSTGTTGTEAMKPLEAIRCVARTDIGRKREENQDSYGIVENEQFKIFAVADGMGGVKGGAIASSLAIAIVKEQLENKDSIASNEIQQALTQANAQIFEKGRAEPALSGMGTTFVALAFSGTSLYITNVGDSRAYRIRQNEVMKLTEDHTLVTELVRSGAITPEQAQNHPVSHMLTRSLGPTAEVQVDCWLCEDGPVQGDIYVLCSDGLYNLVSDEEILSILTTHPIESGVELLIDVANERGGTDNITVLAIEVTSSYPVTLDTISPISEPNGVAHDEDMPSEVPEVSSTESTESTESADEPADAEKENPIVQGRVSFESVKNNVVPGLEEQILNQGRKASDITNGVLGDKSIFRQRGGFLLALVTFFIGAVSGPIIYRSFITTKVEPIAAPVVVEEKGGAPLALPPSFSAMAVAPEPHRVVATEISAKESESHTSEVARFANANFIDRLSSGDMQNILRRRDGLRVSVRDLDDKIAAFERPLSGDIGKVLTDATLKREHLQTQLEELHGKVDVATRRLAVWYGRRKRLQDTDPINMASEIAVSSEAVKTKKEEFERATWSYLKESEVLIYNPADEQQQRKVGELIRARKQRMNELLAAIREAIDQAVGEADQYIAELTLERGQVESNLAKLKRDVTYVKAVMGTDKQVKEQKKQELIRDREAAVAELEELNHLLPAVEGSAGAGG